MKNALFNVINTRVLKYLILLSFPFFSIFSCSGQPANQAQELSAQPYQDTTRVAYDSVVKVGAEQTTLYLPILKQKRIAVVANQTSKVGQAHLVDFLLSEGVEVSTVFSPEHGFRGEADAGAKIDNDIDEKTGLPIISLYGKNKKPTKEQLAGIDIILFDIQDVGARFYTYISTLHYVMEACAENEVKLLVLDRPNPNGHIVDGPVREVGFESFVGMHPVPILHGLTIGEYAKMINGEAWLDGTDSCFLEIIPCAGYSRNKPYSLPVWPSPNLRSDAAIALYPSLCLFEGTAVSVGRGTEMPFTVYGHPKLRGRNYSFKPVSSFGARNPKLEGVLCYGANLNEIGEKGLTSLRIDWLISAYQDFGEDSFFITKNRWFDLLAGTSSLRKQIEANMPEQKIRASWEPALNEFKNIRKKYLIYD